MNSVARYQVAQGRNGSWEVRSRKSNLLVSILPSLAEARHTANMLNLWGTTHPILRPQEAPESLAPQLRLAPPRPERAKGNRPGESA